MFLVIIDLVIDEREQHYLLKVHYFLKVGLQNKNKLSDKNIFIKIHTHFFDNLLKKKRVHRSR
jgi:hypothetical protein